MTDPDSRGGRTRQERELVDAIEHQPKQTGADLADLLKRPIEQVRGVAMGLVRRGVLTVDAGKYSLAPDAGKQQPPMVGSSNGARDNDEGIRDELADAGLV